MNPSSLPMLAVVAAMAALKGPAHAAPVVTVDVSMEQAAAAGPPPLFGFGGNIWLTPEVFAAGVAQRIVETRKLGLTRVSLGDQVLQQATSLADLKQRLAAFPLNEFLRRYVENGGRVLFILDGTPRWISSSPSQEMVQGPNQPLFRMSPPKDYAAWSQVVEEIVRHFNGQMRLNAMYEAWNEPNYYYRGRTEEYLKQYYHSVLGARRADARALVGGPGISEFTGVGTAGAANDTKAEKTRNVQMALEQTFLFRQFLGYASRTPLPELGLKRLPVDFFSWHTFYADPTRYFELAVPAIRESLLAAGYPQNTPLIVTEWNIADVPPYPEGNINATEVGAAFVATSLIGMHQAGVDQQSFQMYVDPGGEGYFGGVFTASGIPRANYHALRLAAALQGRELRTRSSDPWVRSVAFADGDATYLMVTTFVPTARMIVNHAKLQNTFDGSAVTKSIAAAGLAGSMLEGKPLPEPYATQGAQVAERGRKRSQEDGDKAKAWKRGVELEINLKGIAAQGTVTRMRVDSGQGNIYPQLDRAQRTLLEKARSGNDPEQVFRKLREAGLEPGEVEKFRAEVQRKKPLDQAVAALPAARRDIVLRVIRESLEETRRRYQQAMSEIESWPGARIDEETLEWPASGRLRVQAEPYSVQLFTLRAGSARR